MLQAAPHWARPCLFSAPRWWLCFAESEDFHVAGYTARGPAMLLLSSWKTVTHIWNLLSCHPLRLPQQRWQVGLLMCSWGPTCSRKLSLWTPVIHCRCSGGSRRNAEQVLHLLRSHNPTGHRCPHSDVARQNLMRAGFDLCRSEAPAAGWQRGLAAHQSCGGPGPVCAAPQPGCHLGRPSAAHAAGPPGKFRQTWCMATSPHGPVTARRETIVQVLLMGLAHMFLCSTAVQS